MVEYLKEFNLYLDDNNKIHTEDVLILMTDNHLNIVEHSSNILQFTGWTQDDMQSNIEMNGYIENLKNLVQESQDVFEEALANDSSKHAAQKTGIANRISIFKRVNRSPDSHAENFTSLPCVISLVRKPLYTFHSSLVMNIFLILPIQLHPDCDMMANNTISRTRANRMMLATGNNLNQFLERTEDSSQQRNNNFGIILQAGAKPIINTLNSISPFRREANPTAMQQLTQQMPSNKSQQRNFQSVKDIEDFQAIEFDLSSLSSSGSQSSSHGSQKGANYVKSFLFKKRTPRILKINTALIVVIIMVYLLASTFNLFTFLDKHKSIRGRVNAMCLINSRNTHFRSLILNIKMLQQIVQNVSEFNKSTILPANVSRLDFYYKNMIQSAADVDAITKEFDHFSSQNREYLSYNYEFNQMKYVTNLGYLYYINKMQLKQASNTLTEYARSLSLSDMIKEVPPLNVTNYAKNYSHYAQNLGIKDYIGNRSLTTLERNLFAIFENGLYRMFELFYFQYFTLKYISQSQTTESLELLNETTFISIGIVLIICLIIYPLFIRATNNILYPLRIFNNLDRSLVVACQQRAVSYLDYMDSKREKQKAINMEAFVNHSNSAFSPTLKDINIVADSNQIKSLHQDKEIDQDFFNFKNKTILQQQTFHNDKERLKIVQQHKTTIKQLNSQHQIQPQSQNQFLQNEQKHKQRIQAKKSEANQEVVKMNIKVHSSDTSSSDEEVKDQNGSGIAGKSFNGISYARQLSIQKNQSSTQNLNQKTNAKKYSHSKDENKKHKKSKTHKIRDAQESSEDDSENKNSTKKGKAKNGQKNEESEIAHKYKNSQKYQDEIRRQSYIEDQIKRVSLKLKVITFIATVILGIYYTSSFMVSYYMSQQVFNSDKECIDSLQIVFYREICNYDQITFVREKAIQNRTIYINFIEDIEGHTQAFKIDSSFIGKAQESEKSLNEIRKNLPVYLKYYGAVLDLTESDQICNATFLSSNPQKAKSCEQTQNQLFQRGLGQSLQYVNQNIQQIYVTFYGPHFSNQAFLDSIIKNQKLQELADLALYYQKYMHDLVQKGMQDSALEYFDRARSLYILSYVIYLAFTIFGGLLLLIFSYLLSKRYMVDLQNMIIMIPFEQLPQEDKTKIEKHLQST